MNSKGVGLSVYHLVVCFFPSPQVHHTVSCFSTPRTLERSRSTVQLLPGSWARAHFQDFHPRLPLPDTSLGFLPDLETSGLPCSAHLDEAQLLQGHSQPGKTRDVGKISEHQANTKPYNHHQSNHGGLLHGWKVSAFSHIINPWHKLHMYQTQFTFNLSAFLGFFPRKNLQLMRGRRRCSHFPARPVRGWSTPCTGSSIPLKLQSSAEAQQALSPADHRALLVMRRTLRILGQVWNDVFYTQIAGNGQLFSAGSGQRVLL